MNINKRILIGGAIILTFAALFFSARVVRAAVSVSACGTLSTAGETYNLTQDVSASGTCFTISADNVTLNLNGHSITYGTGGGTVYGVRIGTGKGHLHLTNGTIVQSQSAGSFAHAFYASSGNSDEIDHVNMEIFTDSSAAVVALWGTGHIIHHNTITSHVATIQNRHQNQGYAIQFWGDGNGVNGSHLVYSNTIVGSPQGGVFTDHADNSKIYSNDISQGGQAIGYTNDFCVAAYGNSMEIYSNYCHPVQGRGFHLMGNGLKVHDNTINVIELNNNVEYGGCQGGGTYGIQLENPAINQEVYDNSITARADACPAQGLRASEISATNNNRVYNNTIIAKREGSGVGAANAVSLAEIDGGLVIDDNTLSGDSSNFSVDWDGAKGAILRNNIIAKGSNPASNYVTINFANGATTPSTGNILQDSTYQNGADDSLYQVRINAPYEYYIKWSQTINVKDSYNQNLSGARVVIKDKNGTAVYDGLTDVQGNTAPALSEYRRYNQSSQNYVESFSPYSITVTKSGYDTASGSFNVTGKANLAYQLVGGTAPACVENWSCGNWTTCSNSSQTRDCVDLNHCGTTQDKPVSDQSCQTPTACLEAWSCTVWSSCQNGQQIRSCTDSNSCGTSVDRPAESFACSAGQNEMPQDDNADSISPNVRINSGPGQTAAQRTVNFIWEGVDDKTAAGQLSFAYKLDDGAWSGWINGSSITLRNLRNGAHTFTLRVRDLAGNIDPTPAVLSFTVSKESYIIAAPNQGGGPQVRIFTTAGRLISQFFAFEKSFRGGVTMASGDLGGDGVNEIIVGAGPGRLPEVKIFRKNGSLVNSFLAYQSTFRGGVSVSSGDINGDGLDEIITAPMAGGGPNIRIFGFKDGKFVPLYNNFMAYNSLFRGGVSVTVADIEGDGIDEIITAPQSRGGPQLRVFGLRQGRFVSVNTGIMAYGAKFYGGVSLAAGQLNADNAQEIITGTLSNGGPQIRVFGRTRSGILGLLNPGFWAFNPAFRGGVSLAAADTDLDGTDEIIIGVGSQSDSLVRIYRADGKKILREFYAWPKGVKFGVKIASGE